MTDAELIAASLRFARDPNERFTVSEALTCIEELAATLARHQWQPIETAPRDGTDFNVLWRAYYRPEGGLLLVDDPVGWLPALPTGDAP